MEKENIKLVLPEGTTEFTLREGAALVLKEDAKNKNVSFNGVIESPRLYAIGSVVDVKNALVIVDDKSENSSIKLVLNRHAKTDAGGPDADEITGKLELHEEFKKLPIEKTTFTTDELRMWVRKNQYVFATVEEHGQLLSSLQKFQAKINTELKNQKDQSGNEVQLIQKIVETDLKSSFVVSVPILKGGKKEAFRIEIFTEAKGNGVVFTFESNEVKRILLEKITEKMESEIAYFTENKYTVLHKV